jgi:predicted phosphohydrolase
MKVAWATDIHLNTISATDVGQFCEKIRASGAKALLLGGDIAEADDLTERLHNLATRLRLRIYFVLGNHDYYRGDVKSVEDAVRALDKERLRWLPAAGCVGLTTSTALVGNGGWGDARLGNIADSPIILNDFLLIEDLRATLDPDDIREGITRREKLTQKLRQLGDRSADMLREPLVRAVTEYSRVIVLTHVPPFRDACWHDGTISEEDWLPYFTCKAIGDLILRAAVEHPSCSITVLCGHTHSGGKVQMLPNLTVVTGEGDYGRIEFEVIELE